MRKVNCFIYISFIIEFTDFRTKVQKKAYCDNGKKQIP